MNISAQEEHFGQVVSISGMDIIVEMKQELLKVIWSRELLEMDKQCLSCLLEL